MWDFETNTFLIPVALEGLLEAIFIPEENSLRGRLLLSIDATEPNPVDLYSRLPVYFFHLTFFFNIIPGAKMLQISFFER